MILNERTKFIILAITLGTAMATMIFVLLFIFAGPNRADRLSQEWMDRLRDAADPTTTQHIPVISSSDGSISDSETQSVLKDPLTLIDGILFGSDYTVGEPPRQRLGRDYSIHSSAVARVVPIAPNPHCCRLTEAEKRQENLRHFGSEAYIYHPKGYTDPQKFYHAQEHISQEQLQPKDMDLMEVLDRADWIRTERKYRFAYPASPQPFGSDVYFLEFPFFRTYDRAEVVQQQLRSLGVVSILLQEHGGYRLEANTPVSLTRGRQLEQRLSQMGTNVILVKAKP